PYLVAAGPGHPVVLDFAGVEYIASVGLRVLMLASRQVRAQNGTIVVAAMAPLVKEIFEISKFTLVFPCFPSVADALADLARRTGPAPESRCRRPRPEADPRAHTLLGHARLPAGAAQHGRPPPEAPACAPRRSGPPPRHRRGDRALHRERARLRRLPHV